MEQALNNFPVWEQAKGAWGRAGFPPAQPPDGPPWLWGWGLALRAATPGTLTLRKLGSYFWPVPMWWAAPTLRDYFCGAKSSPMRTVWQIWRIIALE